MSLRRPKPPIKEVSAPKEKEERSEATSKNIWVRLCAVKYSAEFLLVVMEDCTQCRKEN